jgi:excisionase family DNA binding protein
MSELVSPKQVAHAIGVSESSLKRWCDQGLIPTVRTAGGHRRLPVNEVLAYLQRTGQPLVSPELLGLPPLTLGAGARSLDKARAALLEALTQGLESAARQIVLEAFLARHPVHVIADDLVAPTFHEIGRQWGCGAIAVYQERHSCEIAMRILGDLRRIAQGPAEKAPRAIGGTLERDHYSLPNALAELVLRDAGWDAVSLGTHLPSETLELAIRENRPQLVWLSVSHFECEEQFVANVERIAKAAAAIHAPFVIGGRMLCEPLRRRMKCGALCDTMQQLDSFARAILTVEIAH